MQYMQFGTPVEPSRPIIRDDFHVNWFPIWDSMGFWIFSKRVCGSSYFFKFWDIYAQI